MNSNNQFHPAAHAWKLWFVALLLAGCETRLDYEARPGLNWFLSTLLMSVAFAVFVWTAGKPVGWQRLAPLLIACTIAGGAVITANPALDALIFLGVIAALAVGLLLGADAVVPQRLGSKELLLAPATAGLAILQEAGTRIGEGAGALRADRSVPTVRGIAMAAPITLVLALLLSNADPVMASWRNVAIKAIMEFTLLGRAIFFVLIGVLMLGALGRALRLAATADPGMQQSRPVGFRLGTTERAIILTCVVALFGLFLFLQLSHLFGNAAGIQGTGLTYAQAAHEGFAELTVAASLCVLLVIALTGSSGAPGLNRREKILSVALIVESQLLLFSAFQRIAAYADAYGYTELRLLVQFYEGGVFIALALLAFEILGTPDFRRLARRCAVAAAGTLIILVYWNHAAWIARENLARFERTGLLDVRYLAIPLGPDAVPELIRSLPVLPAPVQERLRSCLRARYTPEVIDTLHNRAWFEWSYRLDQLNSALADQGLLVDSTGDSRHALGYVRSSPSCPSGPSG